MSAFHPKRTFADVCFRPKADIGGISASDPVRTLAAGAQITSTGSNGLEAAFR
jgi:hypothetical protein